MSDLPTRRLWTIEAALAVTALGLAVLAAVSTPTERPGLGLTVRDASGSVVLSRRWPTTDLRGLALQPGLPEGPLTARLEGYWVVDPAGSYTLTLGADEEATLELDGRRLIHHRRGARSRGLTSTVGLEAGPHRIAATLEWSGRRSFLKILRARPGGPPLTLAPDRLYPSEAALADRSGRRRSAALRTAALVAVGLALLLAAVLALRDRRRSGAWPRWWTRLLLPGLLLLLAGALRLDALVGRYWFADAPPWAQRLSWDLQPWMPQVLQWRPDPHPRLGDPYGYLLAARESRGLYDAHVREPVYVLSVKAALGLLGGSPVAVNLASAVWGTLAVLALWRLGTILFGPGAGFLGALLLALDRHAISLSSEGWRDDAATALILLSVEMLVRLHRSGRLRDAVSTGLSGGLSCLTRLSSLAYAAPALVLIGVTARDRSRRIAAGVAALLLGAVLTPYLLACALAFGDPLFAIDDHTRFYRARQGLSADQPMGVGEFLLTSRPPIDTLDTVFVGLTSYPFESKWKGVDYLSPALPTLLPLLSLLGLALFLWFPEGRLLLLILVSSLVPYAFTWDVRGGGEWRLTLHALPFYLLAAVHAVWWLGGLLRPERVRALAARPWPALRSVLAVAVLTGLWWTLSVGLFALRVKEAVERREAITVAAGPRDAFFFASGWERPRMQGSIRVRRSTGPRAVIRLPLQAGRAYLLVLRLAPVGAGPAIPLDVRLNGILLESLEVRRQAVRMERDEVPVLASAVRDGSNRLELEEPAPGVRRFELWYLRVAPPEAAGAAATDEPEEP